MAKITLEPNELDHVLGLTSPDAPVPQASIVPRQVKLQNIPPHSITGMNMSLPTAPPRSITDNALGPMNPSAPLERPTPAYDRLEALEQKGPGINRFSQHHHILGPILKGLETAGTILSPGAMAAIPGTRMNYRANVLEAEKEANQENKQENDLAAERESAARTALQGAQSEEARARAESLENPPAKPEKEGNPEQQAYDAYIKQGMSPQDAYRKVLADQQGAKPVKPEAPPQTKMLMVNGKPMVMAWNPKTKKFDIPEGEGQPNYGQQVLPTKTVRKLGEDGVEHLYQWSNDTGSYSEDLGPAPTGQAAHQIFQGSAIESLAPQVISDINANRDILGKMSSYYKQWLAGTPVSDPKAAALMAELMSLAAMQPALHAFRSSNALQAFEKMVGGLAKNPDSTIATIQGLLKTPEAFTRVIPGRGKGNENIVGPKIGEVRTINGKPAHWDGHGWLAGKK